MSERVAAVLIDPATGLPYTAIPVNIGSTVNRTASGNITSTQDVALSTAACGSAAFQVSGTWTGTLVFEYTIDDLSWVALSVTPDGGGAAVSSTTANGNWYVQVESYSQVRVRGNTVGSGTAAVFLSASTATSVVTVAGPIPTGDNTIGRVKITDGTDVAAVSAGGALSVDASATTALPLPTGAATAAAQATGNASLSSIDGKTPALAGGRVPVDGSGVTQPVSIAGTVAISAAALPLPSGAATAILQTTGNTSLATLATNSPALVSGRVPVDGSGVTQPVSGTVTANAGSGTFAISAAALPLPATAATDASVTGLQVSQSSATSGQKGGLVLGAVTTAAPSYTTAQSSPLSLDLAGNLRIVQVAESSSTAGVASSATDVTLLAANTSRKGASIYNASTAILYVQEGGAASVASGGYNVAIPASGYYELPTPVYKGVLHGIWASANGYAQVKENT